MSVMIPQLPLDLEREVLRMGREMTELEDFKRAIRDNDIYTILLILGLEDTIKIDQELTHEEYQKQYTQEVFDLFLSMGIRKWEDVLNIPIFTTPVSLMVELENYEDVNGTEYDIDDLIDLQVYRRGITRVRDILHVISSTHDLLCKDYEIMQWEFDSFEYHDDSYNNIIDGIEYRTICINIID